MYNDNPSFHNETARAVFNQLVVDQGVDPDEIIAAARAYSIDVSSSGSTPMRFEVWLQSRPWESRRI